MGMRKSMWVALILASAAIVATQTESRAQDAERAAYEAAYARAKGEALDAYIAGRLTTAYALNELLSPFDLAVDVRDAVVTLRGNVDNPVLVELAEEIARGVEGVTAVRSELGIAERADVPMRARSAFSQRFHDATITARVKTRLLWSRSISGLAIDVDTAQQVVMLMGHVQSPAERALAVQIAGNTDGVARVENRLSVERRLVAH